MDIPGKPGQGLYLLQAYHQLHCLVSPSYVSLLLLKQEAALLNSY